jgi:hypothetical protein
MDMTITPQLVIGVVASVLVAEVLTGLLLLRGKSLLIKWSVIVGTLLGTVSVAAFVWHRYWPVPMADREAANRELAAIVGKWVLYFAVMLLGMAAEYMWGLKRYKEFKLRDFMKPLWVSIILFAPLWNHVSEMDVSYIGIVSAYQNGFFWKVLFDQDKTNARRKRAGSISVGA